MSTWYINNDLPYLTEFSEQIDGFDEYPMSLWVISEDLPYKTIFAPGISIDDAPSAMWKITEDLPFKSVFGAAVSIDDAPSAMWKINNDLPYKSVFAENQLMGAFEGCTNLAHVSIPSTVQSIGPYSFKDTALTEVTLPAECTYYSTSFPPGCTITGGVLIG